MAKAGRVVRQTHRWVSMLFVVTVVATTVALAAGSAASAWIVYTPLLPLALLLLTGLYLFAQPYRAGRRQAGRTPG
jgi:hypothetical protein